MGPRCPDPEEDISGSHLCHGVRCVTSHPSSSSPGSSSDPSFWHQHGGPSFSSSPSPCHHGGSSTPVGSIHDNGADFMSQYLTPLVSSQPSNTPGLLVHLGGIPHGQQSVPSAGCSLHASSMYGLGGTSCVPCGCGECMCAPVPQDTTSMGPRHPDPEEDISGLHLRHGVRWVTSHPPFFNGWLSAIFIPGKLLVCSIVLASAWGAFLLLLSFSLSSWGVFNPLLSFFLSF